MKMRKFFRTLPMKVYLLLLALVLFSFFSNDFGLVDIQKTAIILAAGIDKSEQGFRLTAQIAVPKGVDRAQGGTSSVEIASDGETVSDCISLLFGKTGWVPKLVFCNLIVLGEDAVKEDVISYLNYFLRSEYMPDSCLLAVCAGKAEELISSKSAIDDASSLAIEKLFSDAAEKSGKVMSNTLKDFAIDYYGVTKSSYLPFVRMMPQKGSSSGGTSGNASGGSSGNSSEGFSGGGEAPEGGSSSESSSEGSSGGGNSSGEQIYSAEETALFVEGKMVGLLPREQTFAFSLLKGKVRAGTFTAKEGEKPITLAIVRNDGGISLDMKGVPTAKLSVSVTARLCCRGTTAPIEDISSDTASPELIENGTEVLKGYLEELWESTRKAKCDLFGLKTKLYRSSLRKYSEWKDFLLDTVRPEFSAQLNPMR